MLQPRNRQLPFPIRSATALGVALALLAGCGGDDDNGPSERQAKVLFEAQVNGQDFTCGATYSNVGIGQPGTYQVNDWRFYVYDVALVNPDGNRQALDLAVVDETLGVILKYQDDVTKIKGAAARAILERVSLMV